jgi:glycosyltransferase involved in cell wall biosynthesis
MTESKSAVISFLGNIDYDSRSRNLFNSFKNKKYEVRFIGFDWLSENFDSQYGDCTVLKLKKGKFSLFFYLKFSLILTKYLLKTNSSIYFAEDIYTLPFVVFTAKRKSAKIFYDSRELFGHLAGLNKRKMVQSLLRRIEKRYIKKADKVIVTGSMDAAYLKKEHNIDNIVLVRNLPLYLKPRKVFDFRKEFNISISKKILLYQGVILPGRGLSLIFEILKSAPEYVLIVVGGGEYENHYRNLAEEMEIKDKVIFFGKVSQDILIDYTAGADVGLSLIENISLSYFYALPNKLFEYIMAGIPVLSSNLPQMESIIEKYKVGFAVNPYEKNQVEDAIYRLCFNEDLRTEIKNNCVKASQELNWENEVQNLLAALD